MMGWVIEGRQAEPHPLNPPLHFVERGKRRGVVTLEIVAQKRLVNLTLPVGTVAYTVIGNVRF